MNKGFAALAVGLAVCRPAAAQEGEGGESGVLVLPELVVTADRVPTPLNETGSAVTVITRQEIERQNARFVTDLLRRVPGVAVIQSSGPGSLTEVRIRGAEARQTLVLIDGIEVGDPTVPGGPAFDFGNLLTADVERIEIVRGPQSTLWGADAMGGVINIITRRGEPGFHPYGSAEYGSYDTYQGTIGLTGGTEDVDVALNLTRYQTHGFSAADEDNGNTEDDGYASSSFDVKLEARPTDGLALGFVYRHQDTDLDYDDAFSTPPVDADNHTDGRYDTGRLYGRFDTGAVSHQIDLSAGFFRRDDTIAGFLSGHRLKLGYQGDWAITAEDRLVFGAEVDDQYFDAIPAFGQPALETSQTAAYLQLQVSPLDNLHLSLGSRIDDHSEYGDHETYRATFAYDVPSWDTTLRGSIGTGFKAPALTDLFDPFLGNPDLQPEESFGWDLGIDQSLLDGRVTIGLTYFENRVDNLIVFDPGIPPFGGLENIGKTRSRGVELAASADLTDALRVGLTYTYTDGKDEETGGQLPRRPRHAGSVDVDWAATDALSLTATALFRADGVDNDGAPLDDYVIVDLSANYAITPEVTAFARIDNLFDRDYEEINGYGTAGLSGYVGLRAHF